MQFILSILIILTDIPRKLMYMALSRYIIRTERITLITCIRVEYISWKCYGQPMAGKLMEKKIQYVVLYSCLAKPQKICKCMIMAVEWRRILNPKIKSLRIMMILRHGLTGWIKHTERSESLRDILLIMLKK